MIYVAKGIGWILAGMFTLFMFLIFSVFVLCSWFMELIDDVDLDSVHHLGEKP